MWPAGPFVLPLHVLSPFLAVMTQMKRATMTPKGDTPSSPKDLPRGQELGPANITLAVYLLKKDAEPTPPGRADVAFGPERRSHGVAWKQDVTRQGRRWWGDPWK